ncbi:MAG: GMC family oxidoreductase [Dehalococcoidia bacterium]
MAGKPIKLEADVAIIGGGPGGCTLARELSARGKKVILVEKGGDDDRLMGNRLGAGALLRLEKGFNFPLPFKRTREGDSVILARCLGGGTVIYIGSAFLPDIDYWRRYDVEFDEDLVDEARHQTWVSLPPDEFIGPGTRRVWEAARETGIPFEKFYRHVDFSRCEPACDKCPNGCPTNAKWTAREFAGEAIENGAVLLTNTEVREIIVEGNTAVGVRARARNGQKYEINARVVVCSAGGTQSARILQQTGIKDAGSWFTADPTFFTFGFIKDGAGNAGEHSMAVGWHDEEQKVIFFSLLSPFPAWHLQFVQDEHLKGLAKLHRYGRALGVFCKVSDDGVGRVFADGKLSKTFTEDDMRRFAYSREVNTRILLKAGCDPSDIHHSGFILGHPGGTVKVGQLLGSDLQTSVKNLYCCDASVMPEAPGRPPVLTIVVLAKRLARHLETIV